MKISSKGCSHNAGGPFLRAQQYSNACKAIFMAGATKPSKSGLRPLAARLFPRLARALFMSLLMHHRHHLESGQPLKPKIDLITLSADAV
ncbi:hypothetical protein [Sphingobium yanoikuyae]|uniref:hypothetical protein n=1 Tax=Sphingobium yanoikuyae TaxID=13690 RepID=UPI00242B1C44|nr:hypothetical protein [Sphingobium yanoikuyae]